MVLTNLKIAQRRKLFAADLALERLFAGVRSHVYGEIVFLCETPRAIRTHVRSFAGVRPNVQMQLGGTLERLVALVARLGHLLLGFRSAFLSLFGQLAFVSISRFSIQYYQYLNFNIFFKNIMHLKNTFSPLAFQCRHLRRRRRHRVWLVDESLPEHRCWFRCRVFFKIHISIQIRSLCVRVLFVFISLPKTFVQNAQVRTQSKIRVFALLLEMIRRPQSIDAIVTNHRR